MHTANAAMKNRMEEWLPSAEERHEELKTKVANAENNRARAILQRQADELDAQIKAVKHDLEEPLTSPAELYRGNDGERSHR